MEYLDFDLRITAEKGQTYVEVLNSPAGQTPRPEPVPAPHDWAELDAVMERLRNLDADGALLRELGTRLYQSLFPPPVGALLARSLGMTGRDKSLRLRLHIDDPRLASLPWEYLFDAHQTRRFMALSPATQLVRFIEWAEPQLPLAVSPPLRALVVISSPVDMMPLDADREKAAIEEALGESIASGQIEIVFLEGATRKALQDWLREGFHILHFIGHGVFSRGRGHLVMEDEDERRRLLDAETLSYFLLDTPVRLAVLNACETARIPKDDNPFLALAPALVRFGVPAVVAMQFPMPDAAAHTFARELYAALADDLPLERCMAEARKAIMGDFGLDQPDWGIPVLYSRAPDGRIFTKEKRHWAADLLSLANILREQKDLHDYLQNLLTRLDPFRLAVNSTPSIGDRERKMLNQYWDAFRFEIRRLASFAEGVQHIAQPYKVTEDTVQGPRWVTDVIGLRAEIESALKGSDPLPVRDRANEMDHVCKMYLIEADKAMREVARQVSELAAEVMERIDR